MDVGTWCDGRGLFRGRSSGRFRNTSGCREVHCDVGIMHFRWFGRFLGDERGPRMVLRSMVVKKLLPFLAEQAFFDTFVF